VKNIKPNAGAFLSHAAVALVFVTGMLSMEIRAEDWIDKAAKKIETAIDDGKNNPVIAQAMLDYTHPTGKSPVIASVETARAINGTSLTVTITLNWNGGFTNSNYSTVVTWKCDQTKHISAKVTSDNAVIGVSTENKLRLNTYFQQTFDLWFPAERK